MKVSFPLPSRISCPSFCPLKILDEWRIMRFNSTHKIHPSYLISIETRQTFERTFNYYFGTVLYARSNNFFPIETVDPILNLLRPLITDREEVFDSNKDTLYSRIASSGRVYIKSRKVGWSLFSQIFLHFLLIILLTSSWLWLRVLSIYK